MLAAYLAIFVVYDVDDVLFVFFGVVAVSPASVCWPAVLVVVDVNVVAAADVSGAEIGAAAVRRCDDDNVVYNANLYPHISLIYRLFHCDDMYSCVLCLLQFPRGAHRRHL